MAGGALMQLVAFGAEDVYLTGNPNIYKFKIYYKVHIINDIIINYEFVNIKFIKFIEFVNFDIKNMFNLKLESIDCSNIQIVKLPHFKLYDDFNQLIKLNCSNCKLKNVNKLKYSTNLIYLNCSSNVISKLPEKFPSLEFINFSNNRVFELDCKFTKLKYLIGASNKILQVKYLPDSLIYLDLSDNRELSELSDLPFDLEYLMVTQTKIKKINFDLESKLKYLDVSVGIYLNLDNLPNRLVYLNCSQSAITNLDNLPCGLESLICVNNNLKSLDMLPESLVNLNCDHNNIVNLDNLPNNLNQLICSHNKIKELSNLPRNLEYLNCSNNQNITIKNKPNKLKTIANLSDGENTNTDNKCEFEINFWKITWKKLTNKIKSIFENFAL